MDVLLLHRLDTLLDSKDITNTNNQLYKDNKVKVLGVLNMNSMKIALIQKRLYFKLQLLQAHSSILQRMLLLLHRL